MLAETIMSSLSINAEFENDLVFVNKPAGIPTHAPDQDQLGMAELLQKEFDKKLYVVHRLDKTTTGCLVLASTEKKAQELFELFKNRQIKKKYLFLTDRHVDFSEVEANSFIEKQGKSYHNLADVANSNAQTYFKRIKGNALYNLWEATPTTGKPHQIRLHAAQVGLAILGDPLYGGKNYPHLCLHALELEIPGQKKWISPMPLFFERMGLLHDATLVEILSALDRRQRLFSFLQKPQNCFRLLHLDGGSFRMDLLGPVLWIYWYEDKDPSAADLERFEFLGGLLQKKVLVRKMQNRGQDPLSQKDWVCGEVPETWTAQENELQYQFRLRQGLSPGLFLDQRQNRQWVQEQAAGKSVLNLFSYTCGFSVAAAMGKAREVVTVDLSPKFLEWGKENFKLNGIDPANYQFFAQDSFKFLQKTKKMGRQFDLIICDPPSFSRSQEGVFKIEKDLDELLNLCWSVLKPGGQLLFCSNFEKWSLEEFYKKLTQSLHLSDQNISQGQPCLDFELPFQPPLMKSFVLTKKATG